MSTLQGTILIQLDGTDSRQNYTSWKLWGMENGDENITTEFIMYLNIPLKGVAHFPLLIVFGS